MRVTKERVKSRPEANGLESVELSSDKSGVETELAVVEADQAVAGHESRPRERVVVGDESVDIATPAIAR